MAGGFRGRTENALQKRIKNGYGQGIGSNYKPFLKVRDVSSSGRSTIILGNKTGRLHHFFSDMETFIFVLAEYNSDVVDIREQYALLPPDITQQIAKDYGIKHSTYKSGIPIVMTTDFVITRHVGNSLTDHAICVKPSEFINPNDPKNYRTLEKIYIESEYWMTMGIPWYIYTEKDIPITKAKNLLRIYPYINAKELDWVNDYIFSFVDFFNENWKYDQRLDDILLRVSDQMGLDKNHCFVMFARAVWKQLLCVDLDSELIYHRYPVIRKKSQVPGKGESNAGY